MGISNGSTLHGCYYHHVFCSYPTVADNPMLLIQSFVTRTSVGLLSARHVLCLYNTVTRWFVAWIPAGTVHDCLLTKINFPPWTILSAPTPAHHHGLRIWGSALHSVSGHRQTMVQMEWGPYRNKFHQYILNNLSTILSTTIQPNLTTTNLTVPVADLDSLAAVNGSFPSDTQYEPSLTDTTLFTAEIGFYCGILSAVIVVLIASGVCYTIHVVTNRPNTHSSPIITR